MSHGLLRKYSHAIPLVAGLAVLVASVLMMFFVAPRATAAPA